MPPLAALNLLGDGAHNFVDGMAIAASYLSDASLGVGATVAVVLHELPQEIGDYGVLLQSGLARRQVSIERSASRSGWCSLVRFGPQTS